MTTTASFKDILTTLPDTAGIAALVLLDEHDEVQARLENQPGTAGSVKVYYALVQRFGHIDHAAAAEGLALYAEHTADARLNPGKHPNIDRLLAIAEGGAPGLKARIVLQDD